LLYPITSKKNVNLCKKGIPYSIYDDCIRKHWLTIGDIKRLKKGDPLQLLNINKNPSVNMISDMIYDKHLKSYKLYKPNVFFKSEIVKYLHDKDIFGKFNFSNKRLEHFPVIINNEVQDILNQNTFDIEYKRNNWYPLDSNGYLPAKSTNLSYILLDGKKKHWSEFPDNTHIGWRGPMVIWRKLDNLPKIFYDY
jgi:hypothetical protein